MSYNLKQEIHSDACIANQSINSGENDNNGMSISCKEIQLIMISNWGLFNMIGEKYAIVFGHKNHCQKSCGTLQVINAYSNHFYKI